MDEEAVLSHITETMKWKIDIFELIMDTIIES